MNISDLLIPFLFDIFYIMLHVNKFKKVNANVVINAKNFL